MVSVLCVSMKGNTAYWSLSLNFILKMNNEFYGHKYKDGITFGLVAWFASVICDNEVGVRV